jgi:nitrate reductase / nitrite oxidoreductase, alpha subunit
MTKYKFNARYLDDMLRVSWDTAFTYLAKAMIIIAERYSGESGARRLREQGYPPEMIEMMKGSAMRCMKFRAGMPVLGIIGKMGITRMNGGCGALLDTYIRKVKPESPGGALLE